MESTLVWKAGTSGHWTSKGWGMRLPSQTYSAVLPTSNGSHAYKVTVGDGSNVSVDTLSLSATDATAGAITLAVNGSMSINTLQYDPNTLARSNINISADGALTINKAVVNKSGISETIKLSGGTLSLENKNTNISDLNIDFNHKPGGSLHLDFGLPTHINAKITGFTAGDTITLANTDLSNDSFVYKDNILTLVSGGSPILSLNLQGNQGDFSLVGNSIAGGVASGVCYAAGTHILTAEGEKLIEHLEIGDLVITLHDGRHVPTPIRWLGRRRLDLTAGRQPNSMAPVRIKAGAVADNVPHRDLLVSPDHAILLEGKLICARQLINHMTVVLDTAPMSITYYHVELDRHAILLAEGLPAESYLNTGNDGFFSNGRRPVALHPAAPDGATYPTREAGSVMPFHWQEDHVRPVWDGLAARAIGLGARPPSLERTTDAQVFIQMQGKVQKPNHMAPGSFTFVVPANTTVLHLRSRTVAANAAKPWLEDRRLLSLYVKRLTLHDPSTHEVWEIPLDHPGLSAGWYELEHEGHAQRRWTDGNALIPLPDVDHPLLLTVQADNGGLTYLVGAEPLAA